MPFISNIFPTRPPSTIPISCCTSKPSNNPHVNNTTASHLPNNIPQQSLDKDVWDTLIDDQTSPEDLIHPTPKPQFVPHSGKNCPKKKRGRPKGSKSTNNTPTPSPKISPFMSAVRDDLRRTRIASNRNMVTGILDLQSGQSVNWEQLRLAAPNGLPNPDGSNTDLLQELLPILAQQENDDKRVVTEEELRIKQLIATCYTQCSSIHRSSDRLDNLKPYKLKADAEHPCPDCQGTGMTVCEYCHGDGYVDLGENAEKFNPKFRNNEFTMPRHVMGTTYHCPLCGGLQEERCVTCFGTGLLDDGEQVVTGASKEAKDNRAWKVFDMDELMRQEADRIEIGLDGTIIMRAKPRGRPKKTREHDEHDKAPMRRKRRGRQPENIVKEAASAMKWDQATHSANVALGDDLTTDMQGMTADTAVPRTEDDDQSSIATPGTVGIPLGRPVVRTTDFVNTTDYQVGRRLQRQSPSVGPAFPDSSDAGSAMPQDGEYGDEKPNDLT